ncbi:hypothetical protein MC7420_3900 [Coleofasciculus chthonoplastes PCC 7420]|uniref:DUF4384 domain-containing protein n=1 Tax=Coleofasciculus chthonoplastes PCC 7420 TaxID=118168 RepID=B4VUQ4_9CYAN|nr:DUF4384 domain-containing protein [Coleofasciculus chthonoplastes]EDX74376.1 hypothetical protein MC7420_3900 [Coleofasciculus chthonoplastes PCC 7420]
MNLPNYDIHEDEFLKAIATRLGLSGKTWDVFLARFQDKNSNATNKDIAFYLEAELLEGTRDGSNPATILRDHLIAICDKFEAEGCDYQGSTKGKWKIAKRYLREVLYPDWVKQRRLIPLTCEQLWQELWGQATPTDKMRPILLNDKLQPVLLKPKLLGLEMGEAEIDETAPISIPLNSKIRLDINLEQAGYLLLLEKGTSGKLWCLCPSGFAPKWRHSGGTVTLPLASSRHRYFKLTGSTGWEEIVAVITPNLPKVETRHGASLLPKPGEPLLQLQEGHLTGLLDYLKDDRDCQLWQMAYQVTK